jgi:hypothetical protein
LDDVSIANMGFKFAGRIATEDIKPNASTKLEKTKVLRIRLPGSSPTEAPG